jgi:hypothetical protein
MVRPQKLSILSGRLTIAQIIPVRCFTCGKVVGDKWNEYLQLLTEMSEGWARVQNSCDTLVLIDTAAVMQWTNSAWCATAAGGWS